MYTQCPECQIAFRVTTGVLQKAGGRVRCGGCGSPFSAIDHLSDELPGSASNPANGAADTATDAPDDDSPVKREALLHTLDELAGDDNIRIEDTGIEWRVLDDDNHDDDVRYDDTGVVERLDSADELPVDAAESSGTQKSLDLAGSSTTEASSDERRYDDNTPLPDDFEDEEDIPYSPPVEKPRRRSDDRAAAQTEFDTHQADLALGDDEDWAELLDDARDTDDNDEAALQAQLAAAEAQQLADDSALLPELTTDVAEDFVSAGNSAATEIPMEVEEELAAIHTELASTASAITASELSEGTAASLPDDLESQFDTQAEAMGLDITRNSEPDHELATGDETTDEPPDEEQQAAQPQTLELIDVDGQQEQAKPLPDTVDLNEQRLEDELSVDVEADIVEKLRESTGAFQKQIEAAQQALDRGEVEIYQGPDESADEHSDESGDPLVDAEPVSDDLAALPEGTLTGEDQHAEDIPQELILELAQDQQPDVPKTADQHVVPEQTEEEISVNMEIDQELLDAADREDELSQTMIQAGIDPAALDVENVETIVMEGESVIGSVDFELDREETPEKQPAEDEQDVIAKFDDPQQLIDTYMMNKGNVRGGRRKTDPVGIGVIASIVALLLLLVAQYLHTSRETLATYGTFNQTLGPVYRALGQPVTPQWDVKGWRFETTRGSADEPADVLTIFSRISNASEQPLPYPLVHVSLTDRWEEIIGSKVLEPNEYLAGDLDPRKAVSPGDNFTAVIAIQAPSPEATGFKLNVCYRVSTGRVRCATEDFKN